MIKNDCPFRLNLSVYQQRLRQRTQLNSPKHLPFSPSSTLETSCNIQKPRINPNQIIYFERPNINWIKYNILVSIYQNWLRLQPFVRFWLSKTYQKPIKLENHPNNYLNKKQKNRVFQFVDKFKQDDFFSLVRYRKQQLQKKGDTGDIDIQHLTKACQLAQKIISTLPLQNNKWTQGRIEKQNQLFDQMINTFNQQKFQQNSDTIIQAIKQRIRFIHQMQKKYISYSQSQKKMIDRKIKMLKSPFKKMFDQEKMNEIDPQSLFQKLWQEVQNERSEVMSKNPSLRHHYKKKNNEKYIIQKNQGEEGIVMKFKINRENYNASKKKQKNKKQNKHPKNAVQNTNLSSLNNFSQHFVHNPSHNELTKASINEGNPQSSSQSIQNSFNTDKQLRNIKQVEDFLRRQKLKAVSREQNSFSKKKQTKLQSKSNYQRPSISHLLGISHKSSFISSKQDISVFHQRVSAFAIKEMNNSQLEEATEHQDNLSRFKSHKKLITLKSIKNINKQDKITLQKVDENQPSMTRISAKFSKFHQKEFRKGHIKLKKGVSKKSKTLEGYEIMYDQENPLNQAQNIRSLNKKQCLTYFNKIIGLGHLDEQRYGELKQKVNMLIKQNDHHAILQTHQFVEKLVQKSSYENDAISHLGWESRQQQKKILLDLHNVVKKDERIQMKVREEMKIFFDMHQVASNNSHIQIDSEQCGSNTTDIKNINQQLKRIVNFKAEGDSISFANRLIKMSNSLSQSTV